MAGAIRASSRRWVGSAPSQRKSHSAGTPRRRVGGEDSEVGAAPTKPEPGILHRDHEVGQWQETAGGAQARGEHCPRRRGSRDEPQREEE